MSSQIPQFEVSLKPSITKRAYYQRQRERGRERQYKLTYFQRTYLDKSKD